MAYICPSCKEEIDSLSVFFCSNCGEKLPIDVSSKRQPLSFILSVDKIPPFIERITYNYKKLFSVISILLLITLGGVFSYYKFVLKKPIALPKNIVNTSVPANANKSDLNLTSKTFDSNLDDLAKLVPSDMDFFIYGHDYKEFKDEVLNSDKSVLKPLTEENYNIDGPFVLFAGVVESTGSARNSTSTRSWGFISKLGDTNFNDLEKKAKETSASASKLNDFVIVTTNDTLTRNIRNAANKLALNISLNSNYATAKNTLPKSGKLFVLVLKNGAKESIINMEKDDYFTDKTDKIIDSFLKEDKTGYVVE